MSASDSDRAASASRSHHATRNTSRLHENGATRATADLQHSGPGPAGANGSAGVGSGCTAAGAGGGGVDVDKDAAANIVSFGMPRQYRLLLSGEREVAGGQHFVKCSADAAMGQAGLAAEEELHVLHFAGFSHPGKGLFIDHLWLPPSAITISNGGRCYTFDHTFELGPEATTEHDPTDLHRVSGHVEVISDRLHGRTALLGGGSILFGHRDGQTSRYAVALHPLRRADWPTDQPTDQPALSSAASPGAALPPIDNQLQSWAIQYDMDVSANTGAYYNSGSHQLVWDASKFAGPGVTWESNAGVFLYDVGVVRDPVLGTDVEKIEVEWADRASPQPTFTELAASTDGQIIMSQAGLLSIDLDASAVPPQKRVGSVSSLFATSARYQFSYDGETFCGAYLYNQSQVAAARGRAASSAAFRVLTSAAVPAHGPSPMQPRSRLVHVIHDTLLVDGCAVPGTFQQGSRVHWSALPPSHVAADVLPRNGFISIVHNDPMQDPQPSSSGADTTAAAAARLRAHHKQSADSHTALPVRAQIVGARNVSISIHEVKQPITSRLTRPSQGDDGATAVAAVIVPAHNAFVCTRITPVQDAAILLSTATRVPPVQHASLASVRAAGAPLASTLDVSALMGWSAMNKTADGWEDTCGRLAMDDWYSILVYWMDDGLRSKFISANKPDLPSEVLAVATDDSANETFYKDLQIPYLTAALSSSTSSSYSKQLNQNRAAKLLRVKPAASAIYKRHSSALYRRQWLIMWKDLKDYLADQAQTDRTHSIEAGFASLTAKLDAQWQQLASATTDDDVKKQRQQVLDQMQAMKEYTITQKTYWAWALYYYLTTYTLPLLRSKMLDGALSQDVTQQLKSFNGMLDLLEGHATPASPSSTFASLFMQTVQAFQLTSVLPAYVDQTNPDNGMTEAIWSVLQEFIRKHADSSDDNVNKYVATVRYLLQNEAMFKEIWGAVETTLRLTSTQSTWFNIVTLVESRLANSTLFQVWDGVVRGGQALMMVGACVSIVMVLTGVSFKDLPVQDKVSFITGTTTVFLNLLVSVAKGFTRLTSMWADIGGWTSGMTGFRVFLGSEKVLAEVGFSSERCSTSFAKWLVRTEPETMAMARSGTQFSRFSSIFGRNAGEFMARSMGAVASIVCIVLSAINLAHDTDPLSKTMDSLMLISGSLQLIAIVGAWALSAAVAAEAVSVGVAAVCSTVLACLGPLAVVAAVAGLIVMMVIMFRPHDPPDPIRDLATNEVQQAGLRMEHETEVDYIDVVPAGLSYDSHSLAGVSFSCGDDHWLTAQGVNQPAVTAVSNPHNAQSVLFLTTDYTGVSQLYVVHHERDSKGQQTWSVLYLTADAQGQVSFSPEPAQDTGKAATFQQWRCVCTAGESSVEVPVGSGKATNTVLVRGQFTVQNVATQAFLRLSDSGAPTATTAASPPSWNLVMCSMVPDSSNLRYMQADWVFPEQQSPMGLSDAPLWDIAPSDPLNWAITPSLAPWLVLDASSGVVKQAEGQAGIPPAGPLNVTYTVTATMNLGGQTFTATATLVIRTQSTTA